MPTFRYAISAVQYDSRHNRIENVKAHRICPDDKLADLRIYSRDAVVQAIESKSLPFVTLPTAHDGKFTVGPDVMLIEIGNEKYLKTVASQTPDDNLGDLPEF
ncbi:MAG: DUF3892 domain-containing protein [Mariniblastus sp.]